MKFSFKAQQASPTAAPFVLNPSKKSFAISEQTAGWLFLLPSAAGVCIFVLLPFADTLRRSFSTPVGNQFVGLSNYQSVLSNEAFLLATKNTLRFVGIALPLLLAASLLPALLTQAIGQRGRFFKTTFLVPMALPVAGIVLLWQVLFDHKGLLNSLLMHFGGQPVDFMGTGAAFGVLVFTYLWKNCGYDMVLWQSGLNSISQDLYEAASVDGATALEKFWHITLPNLTSTILATALLSLINTFKVFREAYLVAGDYPHDSIYLLQHLFNNWFRELNMGRLTAGAIIMALGLITLIALLFYCIKRVESR